MTTKAIIIKEENRAKIEAAIAEAEGKARVRTVTYRDIEQDVVTIDKMFIGLAKKDKEGLQVICDPNAQSFPNAYKGIPMSTTYLLTYHNGSWRISEIGREKTHSCRHVVRTMPETVMQYLVDRYTRF